MTEVPDWVPSHCAGADALDPCRLRPVVDDEFAGGRCHEPRASEHRSEERASPRRREHRPSASEDRREDGSIDRAPAREERTGRCAQRTRRNDGADRRVRAAPEAEDSSGASGSRGGAIVSRLPEGGRGEPIDVEADTRTYSSAAPRSFSWRGRQYEVAFVLDHWVESGPWWLRFRGGERIVQQHWWRVETRPGRGPSGGPGGVYDLCWDEAANRWVMARVHD
ncbi:MAG: DUF6504 family protein [Actinomycetota bacterium]|nr:DUF6504 family protein [Actinomycetota bacterium]